MANSKVGDNVETASSETEEAERKGLAPRNSIANANQNGDPSIVHESVAGNQKVAIVLTRANSSRLGTAPELALGNLSASKKARPVSTNVVTPPTPLKVRPSIVGGGSTSEIATGSARSTGLPPFPGPPQVRPRPKPAPPKGGTNFFGSCFGGPVSPSSAKLPSPRQQIPPRRISNRRVSVESRKPPAVAIADAEKQGPDFTTNKPASIPLADTNAPSDAAPAVPRSPSCRCSITTDIAIKTEQSPNEPRTAGDSSMNKVENDPGNSSGQEVLNAQAEEIIAAVKQADLASSRQAEAGVSPIRGLRPNREERAPARRFRNEPGGAQGYGARDRQCRARGAPLSAREYRSGRDSRHNSASPTTSRGVARLFDAIIGPGDYCEQEARQDRSRPQSPVIPNGYPRKQRTQNCKAASSNSRRPAQRVGRALDNDGQGGNCPPEMISRDQGYSDPNNPETSCRDQEYSGVGPPDQTVGRDQTCESATYVDARAVLDIQSQQQDTSVGSSEFRWKKKDPYREVVDKKRDPRRRGYPDPSFNPRPGDIIIRARKRSGLRLTDFYYYDNENYMEQGDQILRAKFEYLPPMDKMYLWCRLYVYGADGTYTYLDSTSESVGKFRSEPDVKTFKEPARFM